MAAFGALTPRLPNVPGKPRRADADDTRPGAWELTIRPVGLPSGYDGPIGGGSPGRADAVDANMRELVDKRPSPSVVAWMRDQARSGARLELVLEGLRDALGAGAGVVTMGVYLIEAFRLTVPEIASVGVWLSPKSEEQRTVALAELEVSLERHRAEWAPLPDTVGDLPAS